MKSGQCQFGQLTVRGFRRLRAVEVHLRPFTVLLGANGVGKTSFLDLWAMLAESASGRLHSFLSARGGLGELITREPSGQPRRDAATLQVCLSIVPAGGVPRDYLLELMPTGGSYEIVDERLAAAAGWEPPGDGRIRSARSTTRQEGLHDVLITLENGRLRYYDENEGRLVEPTWDHNPRETALAQTPRTFREAESCREGLASFTYYGPLDVRPQALVRGPQPISPAVLPGANGEDLVACLYTMRENEPERFEMVEDGLQAAFPDFERLLFPPVAAGTLSMTWKDKRFTRPMYTNQLSEGTLRYLWLTTLLSSGHLPAVTLIDEPEVSLHPELLAQLAELMREASRRTQLIVATHADRLVRFLEPKEVLVCDLEDGEAKLRWADSLDLERWMKDYTLDEVWRLGQLGGRAL